jgi:putative transcription factor
VPLIYKPISQLLSGIKEMLCEVCGSEILGAPQRKIIEGAKLTVCYKCAGFGSAEWGNRPTITTIPGKAVVTSAPKPKLVSNRPPRRNDVESMEQMEFIEDYGAQIRKARQRLGLSEKDLAMKMQEKETVVKKLEKEDLVPDAKLIQKLKQHLGLDVVEKTDKQHAKTTTIAKAPSMRTLGDMIPVKTTGENKS